MDARLPIEPSGEYYVGIPLGLVRNLIDIYFSNVYNATLLLHKPSFLEALEARTVRVDVLLSVCASAANLYRDANGQAVLKDQGFMMEWADRAGKLVFREAESLQEDNIVTFMNLALLLYSQGIWRRSFIHKGGTTLAPENR
ncbi:hypothetical protein N7528_009073 [Penicillium herquei]|nr:hypothetical protein N7528_009073 [Penicillium herquei]